MKLITPVKTIDVKRSFVIANFISSKQNRRKHLGQISLVDFEKRFQKAKVKVLKLKEKQLDRIIGDEYMKRLNAYNASTWYLGEVGINEVGVWKRAGGLPLSWTNGSLKETAERVAHALNTKPSLLKKRACHSIPNILATNVTELQKEKLLLPIVFKAGTGTNGRRGLKRKMKGDIDDGCMRSIALAIAGNKTIRAYIGIPNK